MVPDQDAVESITSQIRLQVYKLSAVPLMSNSSANKTMSTPLTTFEKISNMKSFSNDLVEVYSNLKIRGNLLRRKLPQK